MPDSSSSRGEPMRAGGDEHLALAAQDRRCAAVDDLDTDGPAVLDDDRGSTSDVGADREVRPVADRLEIGRRRPRSGGASRTVTW